MSDDLQFDKAEYEGGTPTCAQCGEPRGAGYYQLGPHTVCARCKVTIDQAVNGPIAPTAYGLAFAAGAGVAAVGAVIWAVVRSTTGMELGILGLGVGWAVAVSMRKVAGRGGLLLQIAAVVFTYLAIVESAVPQLVAEMGSDANVFSVLFTAAFALGMPYFVMQEGLNGILWFVIVGFSMHTAWQQLSHSPPAWVGPQG